MRKDMILFNKMKFFHKYFVFSISVAMLFMVSIPSLASADEYKRITAAELKEQLESKNPPILLDIQKKNAYQEHHFKDSVRTYAYPARTEYDLQSVVQGVRVYERTGNNVVIIGPRGGRASQRTVDYLITRGIPEEKIFILKGGIREWPYKEMLLTIEIIPH